jgi:hypothetical protein
MLLNKGLVVAATVFGAVATIWLSQLTLALIKGTSHFCRSGAYPCLKELPLVSIVAGWMLLLVVFSVIFPALKVLATYLYYYDYQGLRQAGPVRFFALKSGKWSMADVMVIAIFMAYIGFNGLADSQLGSLRRANAALEVLTTNGTALAPGFFLFLGFVLASLLLSTIIENRIGEGHST